MYADHLYIIAKSQDNGNINHELSNSVHLINNCSDISGAGISYEKTIHLHIFNKRNCNPINITYNYNSIEKFYVFV